MPTLEQAYAHCQRLASEHYENFPTASKLLRAEVRPAIAAIYAFARTADDIADEGDADTSTRLQQLDVWETLLDDVPQTLEHPCIHLAIQDAIQRFDLPKQALRDLLHAFRMDCHPQHFENPEALLYYCQHSANPVGRLMLALHTIHDATALQASDAICTALQLTNFWQDFSIDLPKGRCYLADTWLQACDIRKETLLTDEITSEEAQHAIHLAYQWTHELYQQGRILFPYLPFRLRLQIVATWHGGMRILQACEVRHEPLHMRPKLHTKDWLALIIPIIRDTFFPAKATP